MLTFVEKLELASENHKSLLCVGLDPDPERMPIEDVLQFNRAIVDATADLVCAYKPNLAFYEALGLEGLAALLGTIEHIRDIAPDVVIIADAKRGDIGPSMEAYHKAMFEVWDVDAATVSPYLGGDVIVPNAHEGKGVFVLCRTSNPSARDFQDLTTSVNGDASPLYQRVALKCQGWSDSGNVGLVVGATYPQELKVVREICPRLPFLVPGVGAQGGDLESAVLSGTDSRGRLAVINSSRSILYASRDADFPQAARKEAARLRDQINSALTQEGMGWS